MIVNVPWVQWSCLIWVCNDAVLLWHCEVSLVRLRAIWMTNHPPSVLWHTWLGHETCKLSSQQNDLFCVEWRVKPYSTYISCHEQLNFSICVYKEFVCLCKAIVTSSWYQQRKRHNWSKMSDEYVWRESYRWRTWRCICEQGWYDNLLSLWSSHIILWSSAVENILISK